MAMNCLHTMDYANESSKASLRRVWHTHARTHTHTHTHTHIYIYIYIYIYMYRTRCILPPNLSQNKTIQHLLIAWSLLWYDCIVYIFQLQIKLFWYWLKFITWERWRMLTLTLTCAPKKWNEMAKAKIWAEVNTNNSVKLEVIPCA